MYVLGEAADPGWLKASLNGQVGLAPRTHVEITAPHMETSQPKTVSGPGPGSPPPAGMRTAKARHTYVRQNPDELSFEVKLLHSSSFWCEAAVFRVPKAIETYLEEW